MNTVFRVVFNAATRTFTAASEAAKCKKVAGSVLTGLVFVAVSGFANAETTSSTENAGAGNHINSETNKVEYFELGQGNTVADAIYSDTTGFDNKTSAPESVVYGNRNQNSGYKAVTVGVQNTASGRESVAVGSGAKATDIGGTAMGMRSQAIGQSATSIGDSATSTGKDTTAIGSHAKSDGEGSTSLGNKASSSNKGVALGNNASTGDSNNSVALGSDTKATKDNTVGVGMRTVSDVANGEDAHDAVNREQLDTKVNETDFVADQKRQDEVTEENRIKQDRRSNELSDRTFYSKLNGDLGIKYDGDKVVKTDEDLKDTITGEVMHDRNGNALKVRTTERGEDKVTFRGDNGTTLANVADGTVAADSKQAVNGSQLKAVSDVANNSVQYDAPGATTTSPDGMTTTTENGPVITLKQGLNEGDNTGTTIRNVREGKVEAGSKEAVNGGQLKDQSDRIDAVNAKANDNADGIETLKTTKADQSALDETNGNVAQLQRDQQATDSKVDGQGADIKRNADAINTKADKSETDKLWSEKASKSDVNEVREAGVKESEERIKNDKAAQDKINDLYANKADKSDVNEVRAAGVKESEERIKNDKAINGRVDTTNANLDKEAAARAAADANQQAQIDTKADAREVNEWLETKADQSDLDQTNVNVAGNTTAIANESGRAQKAEAANADAAKTAQTSADAANAGVAANGTAIAKEAVERQNDVSRLDSQKLDKDTFAKDQSRQDAALARETQNRTNDVNDARQKAAGAQKTADNAQSGVNRLSETKADASDLKAETRERKAETASLESRKADKSEVAAEAKARQTGEAKLEAKKADRSEVKAVAERGEATRAKVDGVANHQVKQDAAITKAQSTADAGLTVGNAAYTQSRMNAEDIQTLNNAVNAETGRAQKAEAGLQRGIDKNASDIAGLKGDINSVRNEERAGIAAAVAGANIPQAIHAGKGNIGAGFGSFHGSNAVAVGGSYRFSNDSTTIKATVGVGSGSNMTFGAGISQEF